MKNSTLENIKQPSGRFEELSKYTLDLKEKIEAANLELGERQHKYFFECGEFSFILPQYRSAEIIRTPDIYDIPTTPIWFRGMINLRGNLIPVFDLHAMLHRSEPEKSDWLIVFGNEGAMAALCINGLPVSIEADEDDESGLADVHNELSPYVVKTYKIDGKLYMEPDYDLLFSVFHDNF